MNNRRKIALLSGFARYAAAISCAVIAFFLHASRADAVSLDNTEYVQGDSILVTSDGSNTINLYDVDSGENLFSSPSYNTGEDLIFDFPDAPGDYSVVEVNNSACVFPPTDYADCVASPDFIDEAKFTVIGGVGSVPDNSPGVSHQVLQNPSYPPTIAITSPISGTVFSSVGDIAYHASDLNDPGQPFEKAIGKEIIKVEKKTRQ